MKIIALVLYLIGGVLFYHIRTTDEEAFEEAKDLVTQVQNAEEANSDQFKKAYHVGGALASIIWPIGVILNLIKVIFYYN